MCVWDLVGETLAIICFEAVDELAYHGGVANAAIAKDRGTRDSVLIVEDLERIEQ
ncbi:MAG: hypothetical protein ACR2I5_00960 [Candidatus Limnocylindria bacterium]